MNATNLYMLYIVLCSVLLAVSYWTTVSLQGSGPTWLSWLNIAHAGAALLPFGLMALAGLAESTIAALDKESDTNTTN